MKRKAKPPFDPKAFLAKANGGRTISSFGEQFRTDSPDTVR